MLALALILLVLAAPLSLLIDGMHFTGKLFRALAHVPARRALAPIDWTSDEGMPVSQAKPATADQIASNAAGERSEASYPPLRKLKDVCAKS